MKRNSLILVGAVLALILAGCGGGGGGPAIAAATFDGPPATGAINTGSVLSVAGRSVDAALQSGSFGDITDFVGLTVVATTGPGKPGSGRVMKPGGGNAWSQIPVGPEATLCDVDGSVTVSGNIASPLTVTAGDFLDYSWDNCDDGLGQVISGFIGMTFTEFEGDLLAGRILLGVSLAIGNFRVTDGADFNLTNGDLALTIDSRTQPKIVVTTLGSSLAISNRNSRETLTDFSSIVTEDTSVFPSSFTVDATGTVSSTQFNGFVNYDTPVAFQSTGAGYPFAGEMLVVGANNARIWIFAISDVDVRIEADYNGDGAPDATIDTTWDALING
jgi:hypothetical protein